MNLDDNVLKGYDNEIQEAIRNEIQENENENDKAKRHKTTYEELLSEHLYVKATQLYLEQIINANENASIESLEKIKKSQDLMELATASAKTAKKTDAPIKKFLQKNTKEYKGDFVKVLRNITTALDKAYEEELKKHKKEVEKTRNNQKKEENR